MVFTFWEGKMPGYIRLCLYTWKVPYTVLNYDNVNDYTDLPLDKLKRFTLPQIADCVRVHVLRDNGGYWLDADTIMLTGKLPDAMILGDPEKRTNTIGMLHTATPNSEMLEEWARFQDKIIQGSSVSRYWALMGNDFTDSYLWEHDEIRIGRIDNYWPETYMIPGNESRMNKYKKFYFRESHHLADIRDTSLLMLHNSWTPKWYKNLSAKSVLAGSCTLSNILREIKGGAANGTAD